MESKIKKKNYSCRLMEETAYHSLVDFVKAFNSEAGRNTIEKKRNNLRRSVRKELKKF